MKSDDHGNNCTNNSSKLFRGVCPHHYRGQHCNYNCSEFACDECLPVMGDAYQLLVHAKMYEMADK